MGNINFRNEEGKVEENAGSIFVEGMPQEKADSYVGVIQQPTGYVGGFFGTTGNTEEQNTGSYVGGFVSNQTQQVQSIGYNEISKTGEEYSKELPVKAGFWSKIKSFVVQKINSIHGIKIELSPKGEKVLNEVHDFLFQEISFKGFKKSLKNDNNK